MTPLVVVNQEGDVLFSGQADLSPGADVTVTSSVGSTLHHYDPRTPMIKVILPVGEVTDWSPPEDPNQLVFMTETAGSAQERTEKEMEENRIDGTIKPSVGGYPTPVVETEETAVNVNPSQEEIEAAEAAAAEATSTEENEFELS